MKSSINPINLLIKNFNNSSEEIACVFSDQQLSYGSLFLNVNKLANYLSIKGLEKGDIVIIDIDNSINIPIIYFACMWLGLVFIPLNPNWPVLRKNNILSTMDYKLIISEYNNMNYVGDNSLCISDISFYECLEINDNLMISHFEPLDPMYGFFTSGTTGIPKCTLNHYKGLMNRFDYMTKIFAKEFPKIITLQNSRVSFDSSLWQLLWPLMIGGKVIIRDEPNLINFDAIVDSIFNHKIMMTDFVPSILSSFIQYLSSNPALVSKIQNLRVLLVGGESIIPQDIKRIQQLIPDIIVYNTYGPTEASIGMMFHKVDVLNSNYIPIGKPIDNTYAYIINADGMPLGNNESGEIVIGGDCVGLGYLNDPVETKEKFVSDYYDSSKTVFKTGNMGYIDSCGVFHYQGRFNEQVKVNGNRIELREIENAALMHSSIVMAKAIVYEKLDKPILILFVKFNEILAFNELEIKNYLKRFLSNDVIPKRIVSIDSFPLNDNGKTDTSLLVTMFDKILFKKKVRSIVSEILVLDEINDNSNLIEYGANSLDAYSISVLIKDQLGYNIPPIYIINNFSLDKLFNYIDSNDSSTLFDHNSDIYQDLNNVTNFSPIQFFDTKEKIAVITGSSGYVGVHLLSHLVSIGVYKNIYCLIRENIDTFHKKFMDAKVFYNLNFNTSNIEFIDINTFISQDNLSNLKLMKNVSFDFFVLGAKVNLLESYNLIKSSIVEPLVNILTFSQSLNSRVLYLSTNTLNEKYDVNSMNLVKLCDSYTGFSGYDLSKAMCEHIINKYRSNGGFSTVIRVGEVVANKNQIINKSSLIGGIFSIIRNLEILPENISFDAIYIDDLIDIMLKFPVNSNFSIGYNLSLTEFYQLHELDKLPINSEIFLRKLKSYNSLCLITGYIKTILTDSSESLEFNFNKIISTN